MFWDWKEDPPYEELNARIAALLERGARQIRLLPTPEGGDTHVVLVANCDLEQDVVDAIWDKLMSDEDNLSGNRYDWTAHPLPLQVGEQTR